ncbi:hypothetical protein PUN28_018375 [Cardiocondyla obscurior]|uniref:E3 ubiquitin-protein ligase CHFR n=1 Tax=Cardiocondyla obscurior TaxID=286306 RepID=A0AAW2EJC8_9HYME
MESLKRTRSDENLTILEPVLIKTDTNEYIRIDKNEFRIGRAKENDEIILDLNISRKHCLFKCEPPDSWTIKDLSSSTTFVNDVAISPGGVQRIHAGDIIQFSVKQEFRYVFTFAERDCCAKKLRIDEKILDTVLEKQKTFAETQECQRKELKEKLEMKQQELGCLHQQLKDLHAQQLVPKDDKEILLQQVTVLENKIKACNSQEKHLNNMYSQLLEKLENERKQFEVRLNEEKQKWQEALELSNQEKDLIELKIKNQMEKWRQEQQAEWKKMLENKVKEEKNIQEQLLNEKNMLENKVKEEKNIQAQLLNEKNMLKNKVKEEKNIQAQLLNEKNMLKNKVEEEKNIQAQLLNEKNRLEAKLKETEKALKEEQEAKAETSQIILNASTSSEIIPSTSNCMLFNFDTNQYETTEYEIIDTIDLTTLNENILKANIKEDVLEKVNDIMDEQLTCNICSELFVKPMLLSCSHTFCYHCIKMWNKKKKECPICRKPVTSMTKSLVLDNFIESMVENLPIELKNRRQEIIREREVSVAGYKRRY